MNRTRIAQKIKHRHWILAALFIVLLLNGVPASAQATVREQFIDAWTAASRGDHGVFSRLPKDLEKYELFPYLVYEQMRYRRARVGAAEMADFLEQHADWAFASGLKQAWLKTLGQQKKWADFLQYATVTSNTVLRCYKARALIETGSTDGLMKEAQSLWTVGESQPSECDPVFAWLNKNGGITPALAWQRVYLAIARGNARFTLYLARFIPAQERIWLQRWQDQYRAGYRNLGQASHWPDEDISRKITAISLRRFARNDASKAWQVFKKLDSHFKWPANERGAIMREIALQSAVSLTDDALEVLAALPVSHLDDQVLEWWARAAMASEQWAMLSHVIGQMPPESKSDGRWRYWNAIALQKTASPDEARRILEGLSVEASYYGFLAADQLGKPYSICPKEPSVSPQAVTDLRQQADFSRSLELRAAGLENWAVSEWSLATSRLDIDGLRSAAALSQEEGWHDRVIFALGNSGDRQYYDWRFPVLWQQEVNSESAAKHLDTSWVYGVMRAESALAESARSSAGALGLMQITPATARQLSRRYGITYRSSAQLKKAALNIRFGTRFMRELLEKYQQNPVLVSAAYNAGAKAVDRWLDTRPGVNAAVWIETIPYYETRDYIPRVLAFTAIYDWRLQKPVVRVSSRMPDLDSSTIKPVETTTVVCEA